MKLHSKPLNNLLHLVCLNLININVKTTHCWFTGISILYLHLPKETVRAPKFVFKRLLLHIYTGLIFCHLLNFKAADRCFFLKSDQRAKSPDLPLYPHIYHTDKRAVHFKLFLQERNIKSITQMSLLCLFLQEFLVYRWERFMEIVSRNTNCSCVPWGKPVGTNGSTKHKDWTDWTTPCSVTMVPLSLSQHGLCVRRMTGKSMRE